MYPDSLIEGRMSDAMAEMNRNLSQSLYGDGSVIAPRRRRFEWLRAFFERVRDAWDVLRGRASIG